jgi:hypothetical protein
MTVVYIDISQRFIDEYGIYFTRKTPFNRKIFSIVIYFLLIYRRITIENCVNQQKVAAGILLE